MVHALADLYRHCGYASGGVTLPCPNGEQQYEARHVDRGNAAVERLRRRSIARMLGAATG